MRRVASTFHLVYTRICIGCVLAMGMYNSGLIQSGQLETDAVGARPRHAVPCPLSG